MPPRQQPEAFVFAASRIRPVGGTKAMPQRLRAHNWDEEKKSKTRPFIPNDKGPVDCFAQL